MVRKISSSGRALEATIDVFEALKRAMIKRGFMPRPSTNRINLAGESDSDEAQKGGEKSNSSAHKGTGHNSRRAPAPSEKADSGPNELTEVAANSHEILFRAESVFPFVLFPDTITLDREKVTIAERFFFRVAKITSVPVRDILSVEADVGPFFGSIKIASRYFITNPQTMTFLWRRDATELRQLLQGYIIAHERKIDCSNIGKDKLKSLLKNLGVGQTG